MVVEDDTEQVGELKARMLWRAGSDEILWLKGNLSPSKLDIGWTTLTRQKEAQVLDFSAIRSYEKLL